MGRHSRTKTSTLLDPAAPKVVAGITLMIDIDQYGTVTAVAGRMDLKSRRYTFIRYDGLTTTRGGLCGAAEALVVAAQLYRSDVDTGRL